MPNLLEICTKMKVPRQVKRISTNTNGATGKSAQTTVVGDDLQYFRYAEDQLVDSRLTKLHRIQLAKLVNIAVPTLRMDTESEEANELWKLGIARIVDNVSYEVQKHSWYELIFKLLPPIVFSNNIKFVASWLKHCNSHIDPIKTFYYTVERFYVKFKKQKNFSLDNYQIKST